MTTTHALKVASPGEMVALVPYLLGFRPTDSLVTICLSDRTVELTQRIDLPARGEEDQVVTALVPVLLRERIGRVVLIGFEDRPGAALPAIRAMTRALERVGIGTHDRLLVRDGRWRSLDCHRADCCPPRGRPVPQVAEVPAFAEFVAREEAPVPDRAAMATLLLPQPVAAEVAQLLERAEPPSPSQVAQAWRVVMDAGDTPPELTVEVAATAALSLRDVMTRDVLVSWLTPGTLDMGDAEVVTGLERGWDRRRGSTSSAVSMNRVQARLVRLCAMLPDSQAAPALSVLGCFAWWRGNGAFTRAALDRALRCEPDYRLALLLERMLDRAIRPRP